MKTPIIFIMFCFAFYGVFAVANHPAAREIGILGANASSFLGYDAGAINDLADISTVPAPGSPSGGSVAGGSAPHVVIPTPNLNGLDDVSPKAPAPGNGATMKVEQHGKVTRYVITGKDEPREDEQSRNCDDYRYRRMYVPDYYQPSDNQEYRNYRDYREQREDYWRAQRNRWENRWRRGPDRVPDPDEVPDPEPLPAHEW